MFSNFNAQMNSIGGLLKIDSRALPPEIPILGSTPTSGILMKQPVVSDATTLWKISLLVAIRFSSYAHKSQFHP